MAAMQARCVMSVADCCGCNAGALHEVCMAALLHKLRVVLLSASPVCLYKPALSLCCDSDVASPAQTDVVYRLSSATNISMSLFTSLGASVFELCPARGISTKDNPVSSAHF